MGRFITAQTLDGCRFDLYNCPNSMSRIRSRRFAYTASYYYGYPYTSVAVGKP